MVIQFIESQWNKNIFFANAESIKDKLDLGALLSRYSRTHKSIKELYKDEFETNPNKGEEFYQKNFGQYGDESISELVPNGFAVCIEFVPKLWAGRFFHYRTLSGIEKSSRYMKTLDYYKWDGMSKNYTDTCDRQMNKFHKHYDHTKAELIELYDDGKPATMKAIESKTLDYARYLLPMSTLTSFGIVANLRSWLNILGKESNKFHNDTLYQNHIINPLATLFIEHFPSIFSKEKYREISNDYGRMRRDAIDSIQKLPAPDDRDVTVMDCSSRQTINQLRGLIVVDRAKKQKALRDLERLSFTLFIPYMDYGTFFDFQRHRHLTIDLINRESTKGFEDALSKSLGSKVAIIAMGNLREWIHCVELRTQETGHFKYRKIFQDIGRAIAAEIGFPKEQVFPYANWKSDREIGLGRRESELKIEGLNRC
jgi:thymidylate synthase ThyX